MKPKSVLSHVEIERRRQALERWVAALEKAECPVRFDGPDIVHEVRSEPLDWELLIQGIKRALAGDSDPFRLRQRGRKPTYKSRDLVRAVAIVKILRDRGASLEDARAQAAEKTGISEETIRDAMQNKEIDRNAYWNVYFGTMEARREGRDLLELL